MGSTILIADDDPVQRRLLEAMVRRFGYQARLVDGGEAALKELEGGLIDLVILDLVMPDLDGMGVLGRMRGRGIEVPAIVQTAHGSIDAVISAMRAGAADFVVKPVGAERLQVSIRNALKQRAMERETRLLSRRAAGTLGFKDLISHSAEMERVMRLGEKAAASTIPVLIEGEAGTGKQMVARAIHGAGDRRGRPFVAVNCAALPENEAERILFGQEKNAAGVADRQVGKLAEAHGGTLFLDDIGEMPPALQFKLLDALRNGEIEPLGSRRAVRTEFRLISATSRNLIDLVKAGLFREDLYYRLHVYPIMLPPLRVRREDVADLAWHFLARFSAEEGKVVRSISSEAFALLSAYDWPGNVRQLENAIYRAVILAEGDEIGIAELPQIAARVEGFDVRVPSAPLLPPKPVHTGPAMITGQPLREIITVREPHTMAMLDARGDVRTMESLEADMLKFAIRHHRGQMTEVARKLGIGRSTLYRKLKELGLDEAAIGVRPEELNQGHRAA
ncbi:sigma-54-dependent Fis family transcriptional regulator [Labrys miyagiensis]|uniref:DNA-binding transcriptional regulator NtrC n=1 Tax=Labrys miyagiensis TaxID=346912 RepID=A0ABQ6CR85_9HYPH|nr:sigma-54 dependent transcriptional regulator [Labrys miyagiensis]GLS22640.1 sigma-54-dependent Fis family transcriptional regulator [Labrys miyagiensis]